MFTVAVVMGYNPNTMSVVPQIKEKKPLDIILVSLLLQLRVMLIHPVHGKMSVKQLVFSGLEDLFVRHCLFFCRKAKLDWLGWQPGWHTPL